MEELINFSIITVCYNSSATIERTIKSILAQTYQDFEYIIVDGGSTDTTIDIVKRYEPLLNGKMRWKSEPDMGIYDAMNKGIRQATGRLIGIVNSDDWLQPDALANVADAFEKNGRNENALYCGGINFISECGVKTMNVNLATFKRQACLYIMSGIRHPGMFVPRDVYDNIGLFDSEMRLSADQDFVLRCYYGGIEFYDIKHIVSNMQEGGISTENSKRTALISRSDRKIMLRNFNKTGLEYLWLYYGWKIRCLVASTVRRFIKWLRELTCLAKIQIV